MIFIHRTRQSLLPFTVSCDYACIDRKIIGCFYDDYVPKGAEVVFAVPDTQGYRDGWSSKGRRVELEVPDDAQVFARIVSHAAVPCRADEVVAVLKSMRRHNLCLPPPMVDDRNYEVILPISVIQNISQEEKERAAEFMHRSARAFF